MTTRIQGNYALCSKISRRLHIRCMPMDNSCAFHCFSFLVHHIDDLRQLKRAANRRRKDVADYVAADECFAHLCLVDAQKEFGTRPRQDSMTPAEYAQKIRKSHIWGGEVEMLIMSCIYGVQLYIVDVPGRRIHGPYPEGRAQRSVWVLFSGTHYDALVDTHGIRVFRAGQISAIKRAAHRFLCRLPP